MKNKNTTWLGIASLLSIGVSVINALFDGDPATVIDYATVIPLLFAALIGLFSRDAKPSDPVVVETPKGTVLVEQVPTVPKSAV